MFKSWDIYVRAVLVLFQNEVTAYWPRKQYKASGVSINTPMGFRNTYVLPIYFWGLTLKQGYVSLIAVFIAVNLPKPLLALLVLAYDSFRKYEHLVD